MKTTISETPDDRLHYPDGPGYRCQAKVAVYSWNGVVSDGRCRTQATAFNGFKFCGKHGGRKPHRSSRDLTLKLARKALDAGDVQTTLRRILELLET
jgi:hypothetical protein